MKIHVKSNRNSSDLAQGGIKKIKADRYTTVEDINKIEWLKTKRRYRKRRLGFHDWWMIFVGAMLLACVAGLIWVNWPW